MKLGGGSAKGKAFERHVAHMIIDAFASFGITKQDCYRTPLSGGHFAASKEEPSDLVLSPKLRKLFPYVIECKSYRKLDWHKLLVPGPKGHWQEWWDQVNKAAEGGAHDARIAGIFSKPLLVFRQNRSPVFAMLRWREGSFPNQRLRTLMEQGDDVIVVQFAWLLDRKARDAEFPGNQKR